MVGNLTMGRFRQWRTIRIRTARVGPAVTAAVDDKFSPITLVAH